MSRSKCLIRSANWRKSLQSFCAARVARRLLLFLSVTRGALSATAAAGLATGCFLPPDLELAGADAGPSARPIIVRAQPPEFAFPGPIVFERADARRLTLEVEDRDAEDTVYVRLYVDYNRPPDMVPTPPWADCQAAPNGEAIRFVDCPTQALCNPIAGTDDSEHVLEAMASDRPFIPDADLQAEGQPPYRAVADPQRAATFIRSWLMSCKIDET
jgi:hypothetical protein